MTTIDNLGLDQVCALKAEAEAAGDEATVRDCRTLIDAYDDSDDSCLPDLIDGARGEIRAAAERIVRVIRDAADAAEGV